MSRTLIRLLLVSFLLALALRAPGADAVKPERRKTEEKQFYDDGSLHFSVPLDANGERDGQFTAYYRGGKKVQQRVKYEKGLRTGLREIYDANHQLISEEYWVGGKLVFPKSIRQIEAERARLLKEAAAFVAKMPKPGNPDAPRPDTLTRALWMVNAYRSLADVPSDVTLDDEYINLCQYAAELLVAVGHLTHAPPMPAGYDEMAFKLGRDGCGRSNLYQSSAGASAADSVDRYMNDSDASNIDRLGHRRWVLNPRMAKTGFGESGRFSAMYSFDRSREEVPEYEFVCFPPRGLCPLNMFPPSSAWHVSVNPAKYVVADNASLEIFQVDTQLKHVGAALVPEYSHVDRGGFGISNAIIAKPSAATVRAGVVYEVVVHGVKDQDDKTADLSYYVSFYNSPGK